MPNNLYQRGSAWYYRFELNGREYRGSCFTHDSREARRVMRQKMAEAEANPTATTVATTKRITLAELEAWDRKRALVEGSSARVVDTGLGSSWKRLRVSFEHVGDISADAINTYCLRHQEQGLSNQTLKRDIWALRRGYEEARHKDASLPLLGRLPKLGKSPPGQARGQEITLNTLVQWLAHLKPEARAKALIGMCTGIRAEELERYERSWLTTPSIEGRVAWLLTLPDEKTKGKRSREIVVCREVADMLLGYAPFKVDYRRAWTTASTRVGLTKPISMRDLRTTFASTMGQFDYPATKVAMGHAYGREDEVAMLYQRAGLVRLRRLAEHVSETFAEALALAP